MVVTIFGISLPPKSTVQAGNIPGYNYQIYSRDTLLNLINRQQIKKVDANFFYTLNEVVFKTLPHGVAPASLKFQHNWLLYLLHFFKGKTILYTQNSKYIVLSDAAVCSQKARVINDISKLNNINARFVSFEGHVFSEVFVNQKWLILDPDFGIVLPFGSSELNNFQNHYLIRSKLLKLGYKKNSIDNYINIVSSNKIKVHKVHEAHETKVWYIELTTRWLSLGLPILFVVFFVYTRWYKLYHYQIKI